MDALLRLVGLGAPAQARGNSPELSDEERDIQSVLEDAYQPEVSAEVIKGDTPVGKHRSTAVDITAHGGKTTVPVYHVGPGSPAKSPQKAAPAPGSCAAAVLPAVYGITNLASVISIVVANKMVLYTYHFRFAVTLTWLHTIFTAFGMIVLAAAGVFETKPTPFRKAAPVAAVYVGFIVLNNLSIQLNTVGFYQISKICITPVVIAIEFLCYKKTISMRVAASTLVLLVGVGLSTVADNQLSTNPAGVAVAIVSVVVSGLYQVWAGVKQKELELSGLQLLHAIAPIAVAFLGVLIPILEPVGFSRPGPDTILGFNLTPAAATWIVVSCTLGLLVTTTTFLFIGATSPLTYNVVGHLKTVGIVGAGILLFGETMGLKKLLGLTMAMSGIVWYSHLKMTEATKARH